MEVWERKAAKAVNIARSLVRDEQNRVLAGERDSDGRETRVAELEEIMELLTHAKVCIDPHRVVEWEYQTPLPF